MNAVNELKVIISAEVDKLNKALNYTKKKVEDTKNSIEGTTKTINKSVSKSSNQMKLYTGRLIKRFFFISLILRPILKALEKFNKLINNGLSNVYKYSSVIGGDFAKNIDSLRDSLSYYGNSLAVTFVPTLNAIIPVLTTLIDKLADFNNKIAEMNAYLHNQPSYLKAVKKEGVETFNVLLQNYQKLKRTVAGFDELNIINNNNDVMDMFTIEEVTIEKPLNSFLDKVKETAEQIKNIFTSEWDRIVSRIQSLGSMFEPIGEKIKGIFDNLDFDFWSLFDPSQMGILDPFFGIDIALDSETFEAITNAVPTALDIWVNLAKDFQNICQKIGILVKDIVTTLTKPIDSAIADLINSIVKWYNEEGGKEWLDQVGKDIETLVDKVQKGWEKIKPTFERIGAKLTKIWDENVKPMLDALKEVIVPLWELITNFLGGEAEYGGWILWLTQLEAVFSSIEPIIMVVLDALKDILKIIKPVLELLNDFITLDFSKMGVHFEELWDNIVQTFIDLAFGIANIVIGFINQFVFALRDVSNWCIDAVNGIKGIFGGEPTEHVDWTGIPYLDPADWVNDLKHKQPTMTLTGWESPTLPPPMSAEDMYGPVAGPDWKASDYFDTTDDGALSGSQTIVLEVDGQALGRASLTNINRLSRQAGYVNLNLAY